MRTPAEVCDAIQICVAIGHGMPWKEIAAVVAAFAFIYGLAMSIAFFLYLYRSRVQRRARRAHTGA